VDNWKNITNSHNSVRKKSFGGTIGFSNCHIIRLDTGGLVFLVSVYGQGLILRKFHIFIRIGTYINNAGLSFALLLFLGWIH
jgi:hypothetical protein